MSEMTTAEMVAWCNVSASTIGAMSPPIGDSLQQIAARLEALDKVARAGQSVVDAVGSRHGRIVALGEALKEAGYGT